MADLIVSLILGVIVLSGWTMGWIFLLRERGNRKANLHFGLLLLLFSLCVLDNLLAHAGLLSPYREKYFVPIWYTLALGPAFFFSVKFTLYPAYEFRPTDAKHLILPFAQALFYWSLYFSGPHTQNLVWDNFIAPFYKTFEGILYVSLLFTYLALAYRYVKYKQAVVRRKGSFWEYSKTVWLQWTNKVFFALAALNTSYILMDFVVYNFLGWNLYSVKGFSYLGDLSFAAMLAWITWRGAHYVFGVPYPTNSQLRSFAAEHDWARTKPEERLFHWIERDQVFLDPELYLRRLAFLSGLSKRKAWKHIRENTGLSFSEFVRQKRLENFLQKRKDPRYRLQSDQALALNAGFPSWKSLQKILKRQNR